LKVSAMILSLLIAAAGAASAGLDPAAFRRGAAAVDTRTSPAMAVRAEPSPSPSFRLGAAYRAWRNATAAAEHDATHSTGDGGDDAVLAEDCTDERVAFNELETERTALSLTPEDLGKAGAIDVRMLTARAIGPPKECR
jgi:hypothetical protein